MRKAIKKTTDFHSRQVTLWFSFSFLTLYCHRRCCELSFLSGIICTLYIFIFSFCTLLVLSLLLYVPLVFLTRIFVYRYCLTFAILVSSSPCCFCLVFLFLPLEFTIFLQFSYRLPTGYPENPGPQYERGRAFTFSTADATQSEDSWGAEQVYKRVALANIRQSGTIKRHTRIFDTQSKPGLYKSEVK